MRHRHPRSWWWRLWIGNAAFCGVVATAAGLSVWTGNYALAAVFLPCSLLAVVPAAWVMWNLAYEVVLGPDEIRARTFTLRRVRAKWSQIAAMYEFENRGSFGGERFWAILLRTRGGDAIVLTDAMDGFADVCAEVKKAALADGERPATPAWWQRLLWTGWL